MRDWYVNENGAVRKARDFEEGAAYFGPASQQPFADGGRVVVKTQLPDGVSVSTVFLCVDHQWGDGPPLLFETMIFGGEHDGWQKRAATVMEALDCHAEAMSLIEGRPYEVRFSDV